MIGGEQQWPKEVVRKKASRRFTVNLQPGGPFDVTPSEVPPGPFNHPVKGDNA